jgi:hypothetical protein
MAYVISYPRDRWTETTTTVRPSSNDCWNGLTPATGAESASLNLTQLYNKFRPGKEVPTNMGRDRDCMHGLNVTESSHARG